MAEINKELYDALIEAKVSDEKATAAARANSKTQDNLDLLTHDLTESKVGIAELKARLAIVEKLQWGILLGVAGILFKAFLG